jgi:hypothetical protein
MICGVLARFGVSGFATNKVGVEFSWDFEIETDDYAIAMKEGAVFLVGSYQR